MDGASGSEDGSGAMQQVGEEGGVESAVLHAQVGEVEDDLVEGVSGVVAVKCGGVNAMLEDNSFLGGEHAEEVRHFGIPLLQRRQ